MFDIDLDRFRIVDLSYEVVLGQTGKRPFVGKRGLLADGTSTISWIRTPTWARTWNSKRTFSRKDGMDYPLTEFMGRGVCCP